MTDILILVQCGGSCDGLTPSKAVSFNEQYHMMDENGINGGRTVEHENCTYFTNFSDASGASSSSGSGGFRRHPQFVKTVHVNIENAINGNYHHQQQQQLHRDTAGSDAPHHPIIGNGHHHNHNLHHPYVYNQQQQHQQQQQQEAISEHEETETDKMLTGGSSYSENEEHTISNGCSGPDSDGHEEATKKLNNGCHNDSGKRRQLEDDSSICPVYEEPVLPAS
ncbi:hypothetical protein ZHAS_00010044 [Anopheles sinensis]|uniref:Uncharacterized protein n=1 Tax=Anopheles sinensis TaxID=74873 RepID=A0A084VWK5_ANOSI|nr:hypothetical protein ZHAS_00010044 [Anopheles sinensis]